MSEKKDAPEAVSDEALDQAAGGLTSSYIGETEKRLGTRTGTRLPKGPAQPDGDGLIGFGEPVGT